MVLVHVTVWLPVWWAHKASEGLAGFPHTQDDTQTHKHMHTHISIHTGSICYSTAGGVIHSDTIILCSGQETHIHMWEHTHTHLYVVILQSTSKALGIEIPFLSLFSIWWQRGERGASSCTYNQKCMLACVQTSLNIYSITCVNTFPER